MLNTTLTREIVELSHQPVSRCFQCQKCSLGCPVAEEMDYLPHQAVDLINKGQTEKLIGSKASWICVSCKTCVQRCPNGIDVGAIHDAVKHYHFQQNLPIGVKPVADFYESFLDTVYNYGRAYELGMIVKHKFKTKNFTQDVKMGITMFFKGKIKLAPHKINKIWEVKNLFTKVKGSE
ncbi:4Fe-4S dicluster domain-containing protein [Carboxydothermus pertinax]|uniref:4Fe-4S ferredoxin-type domain-containing protein n=1 Tax=Carboxydothermus pertinax TaxID=870242 RepID=A0A1L8CUG2_9THEO|nr:4Fe-4S dicluster domain-containing protein [Carboxydothermus pertinax]GAV22489.1 hypothetical protein cpu_09990 [Carboxydothermus pertinax]